MKLGGAGKVVNNVMSPLSLENVLSIPFKFKHPKVVNNVMSPLQKVVSNVMSPLPLLVVFPFH